MVVWGLASAVWAGEERAPRTTVYDATCDCLRITYDDDHVPDHATVPFGDVESVRAVPGPDELLDVLVHTRAGADWLIYRAPCLIARDFGLRFATNLGLQLTGDDPATACPDKVAPAFVEWASQISAPTQVTSLDLHLADVEVRGRGGRLRPDVQQGLSNQRGILGHCFAVSERTGVGRYRVVLDRTGIPTSMHTTRTSGSEVVDACVQEAVLTAPDPIGTGGGRAWIAVRVDPVAADR